MDDSLHEHVEDMCTSLGLHDSPSQAPASTIGSRSAHTSEGARRRLHCVLDSAGDVLLGSHDQHPLQASVMAIGNGPQDSVGSPSHKLDGASKPAEPVSLSLCEQPHSLAFSSRPSNSPVAESCRHDGALQSAEDLSVCSHDQTHSQPSLETSARLSDSLVVNSNEHNGIFQPAENVAAGLPEQISSKHSLAISTGLSDSPVVDSEKHDGNFQPAEDEVISPPEQPHPEALLAPSTRSSDGPVVDGHKHDGKPQPAEDMAAGLAEQHLLYPLLAPSTRSSDGPVVDGHKHNDKSQPAVDMAAGLAEQHLLHPLLAISRRSSDGPMVDGHKHNDKSQPAEGVAADLAEQQLPAGPTAADDLGASERLGINKDTPCQPSIALEADQSTACQSSCDHDILKLLPSAGQAERHDNAENLHETAGIDAQPQNPAKSDCQPRESPDAEPGQQQAPIEAASCLHQGQSAKQMAIAKLQSLWASEYFEHLAGHARTVAVQSPTLAGASMADSRQDQQQQQQQQPGPFINEPAGLSVSSQPQAGTDQQQPSAHDACRQGPQAGCRWQHAALSKADFSIRAEIANNHSVAGPRGGSIFLNGLTELLSRFAGHVRSDQTDQQQQQHPSHLQSDTAWDTARAACGAFRKEAYIQEQTSKRVDAAAIVKGPYPCGPTEEQGLASSPASRDTTSNQANATVAVVCGSMPFVSCSLQSDREDADGARKGRNLPELTCVESLPSQRLVRDETDHFKAAVRWRPTIKSRFNWHLQAQPANSSSPPGQVSGRRTSYNAVGPPRIDQQMHSASRGLAGPGAAFKEQLPGEVSRSIPPFDGAASALQQLPGLADMAPDVMPIAEGQPGLDMPSLPAGGGNGSKSDSHFDAAQVAFTSVATADAVPAAQEMQRPVDRHSATQEHLGMIDDSERAIGSLLGKRSPAQCLQLARKRDRTELHMGVSQSTSPKVPSACPSPHGQADSIATDMPSSSRQLGAGSLSLPEIGISNGFQPAGATPDMQGSQHPMAASGLWRADRQPGVAAGMGSSKTASAGTQMWSGTQQVRRHANAHGSEPSLQSLPPGSMPPVASHKALEQTVTSATGKSPTKKIGAYARNASAVPCQGRADTWEQDAYPRKAVNRSLDVPTVKITSRSILAIRRQFKGARCGWPK